MHNKQLKTLLVLPKWKKAHQTGFCAGNGHNKRQRAPSAGPPLTHEFRASWSCQFVDCLKKRCKNCTYWCLHLLRQGGGGAVRKTMLSLNSPVPFKGFRQGNAGWGEVASLSCATHCELNLLGRVFTCPEGLNQILKRHMAWEPTCVTLTPKQGLDAIQHPRTPSSWFAEPQHVMVASSPQVLLCNTDIIVPSYADISCSCLWFMNIEFLMLKALSGAEVKLIK